ncbi:MAG TPA: hypothetical protein VGN13_10335 [Solirubrobacteraceae bacterium]
MSTRWEPKTRLANAGGRTAPAAQESDPAQEVAQVARAKRELLLRVHRHRLYRAGIRPIGEILRLNPLAQDYVHWGSPGPGRWVTLYATDTPTAHVFVTIAGLRLDTSHNGTDVGPNRDQDGPRWRILDHIPTWAQWSIRHPPGL